MQQPPAALKAPTREGSSNEARTSHDYGPALNAHASQRFHSHFTIAKTLGGYCRGYNPGVSQDTDQLAGQEACNALASEGLND